MVAPFIIFRAMIWRPGFHSSDPSMYVIGLYAMTIMYSLYCGWQREKPCWWAGIAFVFLYATVFIWRTSRKIATARKTPRARAPDGSTTAAGTASSGRSAPQEDGIPSAATSSASARRAQAGSRPHERHVADGAPGADLGVRAVRDPAQHPAVLRVREATTARAGC